MLIWLCVVSIYNKNKNQFFTFSGFQFLILIFEVGFVYDPGLRVFVFLPGVMLSQVYTSKRNLYVMVFFMC